MNFWLPILLLPLAIAFVVNFRDPTSNWFSAEEREAGPLYCALALLALMIPGMPGIEILFIGVWKAVGGTTATGSAAPWIIGSVVLVVLAGLLRWYVVPRLWPIIQEFFAS